MEIKYLKELKIYTWDYLEEYLGLEKEVMLKHLTYNEILKKKEWGVSFEFTGLLTLKDKLIGVLPKCYEIFESDKSNYENLKLIAEVLKKYGKDYSDEFMTSGEDDYNKESGILSIIDFFFNDYTEYGLYSNLVEEHEINGNGEINWVKTIEETEALISGDEVFYVDYYTRINELDEHDYIRQLHKAILNDCFKNIEEFNDLFEFPEIDFNIENLILPEKEAHNIIELEREMRINFSERKQRLLVAMINYIKNRSIRETEGVNTFGVRKFYNVWERSCQEAFGDQYGYSEELKDIMAEKTMSRWHKEGNKKSMIPDIVTETDNEFYLLDAKYYSLENGSFPGVQDVAKQFMYEQAFAERIRDKKSYNAFICPGEKSELFDIIEMNLFEEKEIKVIKIDYKKIFETYIGEAEEPITLNQLKYLLDSHL